MHARNAIFSQNRTTVNNSNYPTNNYASSQNYGVTQNYGTNQNKDNTQELKIGSNRLQYDDRIFPTSLRNTVHQWREEDWPASIVCRRETLHLSNVEFRLEDYYLIRNKKLSAKNQTKLVEVINYSSFNKELLDKPVQLLPYSQQPVMSEELLARERNKHSEASNRVSGSANSNSMGGNNSNMFGGQNNNTSNNIFVNNRSSNAPTIFGNNNNSYTGNYNSNASNYNQNRTVSTGNIFNNNSSSNYASNNIFARNSSSASNTQTANTNTNAGNNIFSKNNTSNNNTSNNSNNNNTNANTQNAQGSSNNIFSNKSSNQGNNSSTNNAFSNNSNNNNLFTNNSNNCTASGNSQPSNVQQQYTIDVNTLMQSFQNYVQNSQNYLHHLNAQNLHLSQKQREEQAEAGKKDVWSEMREESVRYNNQFQQQEKKLNFSRRREEEDSMVLMLRKPKQLIQLQKAQQLQQQQFQNISYNHLQNQSRTVKNETNHHRNAPQKIQETNFNKSARMNNQLPNKSVRLSNYRDEFSSMIFSRCDFTVNQNKLRELKLLFDEPCTCEVMLDIFWQQFDPKEKRIHVKNPTRRIISFEVAHFDFQTEEGRKYFECDLKKSPFVKGDAKFIPDKRKIEIDHYNASVKVAGRVEQKILNLQLQKKGKEARSPSPTTRYHVQYSQITDSHIQNLTISRNGKGTIVWEQPVSFETLDFKKDGIFFIDDYEIGCQLVELQGPCIVTFETLPPQIQQVMRSTGLMQAKYNLKKMLQKMNKDIQFGDMWQNGSWFFKLKKGFDI